MLFNTWTFLCFAVVVFTIYYQLKLRGQNRLLLVASYVFYGAWDYRFLSLILLSTVVDYFVGARLHAATEVRIRKRLLLVSCAANLGILGIFKYAGFFADGLQSLFAVFGVEATPFTLEIVLPVGISFYTFQTMSYTIDIYRRKLEPVPGFLDFALFVSYFPQLVAGPIERARHLLPQLTQARTISRTQITEGLWLIGWGLFKKAIIADNIAARVDEVFRVGNDFSSGSACLFAIYGFSIQIYCDFSGYSDIARGLGKLMGIELMRNFQLPYVATNPQEFWRRWHISLSTWLRDYLYVPLGGSRGSRFMTYRNLMLTMILGGLWHGAAWTYVLWGFYQGLLLITHRWVVVDHDWLRLPGRIGQAISWFCMFHLTCLGWLIFRSKSMDQIWNFLRRIGTDLTIDLHEVHIIYPVLVFGGILVVVDAWIRNADDPRTRPGWNQGLGPAVAAGLALLALIFWPIQVKQFIYFQF